MSVQSNSFVIDTVLSAVCFLMLDDDSILYARTYMVCS